MEGTNSLLNNIVVAATQYNNHKIERNLVYLQGQIDVLISKTSRGCSLKFFNPSEILPADCLTVLVNLVSDSSTKSTLLLKCLLLFNNLGLSICRGWSGGAKVSCILCHRGVQLILAYSWAMPAILVAVSDQQIRQHLHENFQLTPALANVLKYNGTASSSDTITAEALQLMQKVTYGHRISFQETYMEDLVRFLQSHVTYPATGLTQPALGVLVNLTRDNFSVQSFIKNSEDMTDLSRRLTKLLGDDSHPLILFSLTLLANLCLQEKLGSKLFNDQNVTKSFQMIFNLLVDGDAGETRRYAVDLFKDLLKSDRFQRALASLEFLSNCIEQVLHLLTSSSPESVVKVFELLMVFCRVDGVRLVVCKSMVASFPLQDQSLFPNLTTTPLSRVADPLLATLHWAGQSTDTHGLAPLGAFDLLTEVYEELVFSHDSIHHSKHAAAVLPVVLQTLKTPLEGDNSSILKKCARMVKAVKLLLVLCGDDNLLNIISQQIDGSLMSHLLQYQFDHNTVCLKTGVSAPTDDWSSTGVDLVLYLLDLVSRLKQQDVEDLFMSTMQDARVVPFLAMGLSSTVRERVQAALSIVCLSSSLEAFPSIILGDSLSYRNAERENKAMAMEAQASKHMFPSRQMDFKDKENKLPQSKSDSKILRETTAVSNVASGSNMTDSCVEDSSSIQSLIEKMNTGLGVKDPNTTEIISVYERSLQALQTKEQHLQDLLEAKSLALNQADRMLNQYRARKGQDEAEANRLRSLLIASEKKKESLTGEVTEMGQKIDKYIKEIEELDAENQKLDEVAKMHQQLTTAHSELTEKYEDLQKAHTTIKQEHKSLTEMHEMLQKHNQNLKQQHDTAMEQLSQLQDERRKLSNQLKTSETKLADMTRSSLKWEYDYKRSEEERETIEGSMEKLRSEMGKTDAKKKEFAEKVSQLEFVVSQNEVKIREYEEEINVLKTEIGKHQQIAALINSLSSGNTSGDALRNIPS